MEHPSSARLLVTFKAETQQLDLSAPMEIYKLMQKDPVAGGWGAS